MAAHTRIDGGIAMRVITRITKSRKTHRCISCGELITKGSVYYSEKTAFKEDGKFYSGEIKWCPKCKYKHDRSKARFESFKLKCHHPLIDTKYDYIPGEAVMEPQYDYCLICGKIV